MAGPRTKNSAPSPLQIPARPKRRRVSSAVSRFSIPLRLWPAKEHSAKRSTATRLASSPRGGWRRHDRQHVCARAVARERRARRCRHRARARDRRQDATRTRLYRGDRGLLRTLRRAAAGARMRSLADAFEALAARYKNDDETQIFSALYLTASQPLRTKLCARPESGGDPRCPVREAPGSSRCRSLSHSRLTTSRRLRKRDCRRPSVTPISRRARRRALAHALAYFHTRRAL